MDIPTIIRHYRGNETLRAFAQKLGVSHAAVQQWESGVTEPKDELIDRFANSGDPTVAEMGKRLFVARHGTTLKTLLNEKTKGTK